MSTWRSRVTGYAVSAFVVNGILVDTGFSRVGAELQAWLAARPVRGVFVTHGHEDHAGHRGALDGAAALLRAKAEWMSDTVGRIETLIDAGWADEPIRREVLGREPREHWISRGHYSKQRTVEAVRLEKTAPICPGTVNLL